MPVLMPEEDVPPFSAGRYYDLDRFRKVSLEVTTESAELAFQRARCDANQARQAYLAIMESAAGGDHQQNDDSSMESLESSIMQQQATLATAQLPQSLLKDYSFDGTTRCCHHPRNKRDLLLVRQSSRFQFCTQQARRSGVVDSPSD